jgi:hypothetical protein
MTAIPYSNEKGNKSIRLIRGEKYKAGNNGQAVYKKYNMNSE